MLLHARMPIILGSDFLTSLGVLPATTVAPVPLIVLMMMAETWLAGTSIALPRRAPHMHPMRPRGVADAWAPPCGRGECLLNDHVATRHTEIYDGGNWQCDGHFNSAVACMGDRQRGVMAEAVADVGRDCVRKRRRHSDQQHRPDL